MSVDGLKMRYLEKLMQDCRVGGTQLVFVLSPSLGDSSDEAYRPALRLCEQYGCPVLNHYTDPEYVSNQHLFKDSYHLNREGAALFTAQIVREMKEQHLLPGT